MAVLCAFLVVACYYDYIEGRIPNVLLLLLFLIGMGGSFYEGKVLLLLGYLVSALCMMLILYPLFKIGGLGAGDVKLIGICAGYLPVDKILFFLFFSLLIAAIISLIRFVKEHNLQERLAYLCEYLTGVLKSGHWRLYIEDDCTKKQAAFVCPVPFCAVY